ncbi:unnamed protein product [Larinioides sclopetarius]|uniref:THAP-type domain-containing protein n=1 Tax=Larinioides sclopetarius TaxID=280406 RepID=A0AAV2AEV7_9ARAC
MPCKCSVPACRGNYDEANKVAVFSFPNDENLRAEWLRAIPWKDLNVKKNSKVCEKHFKDGEVLRLSTFYIEKTGEKHSCSYKKTQGETKCCACRASSQAVHCICHLHLQLSI